MARAMGTKQPSIQPLLPEPVIVEVLDVGANPIDQTPPYKLLLEDGRARVVGFEPNPDALARLNAAKGPAEQYLPHAIGDGTERDFHVCAAEGMSSLLKPDPKRLAYFQGLPEWGEVLRIERVQTHRLDDVAEIGSPDLLKIDVQGAELEILQNAPRTLAGLVAIHTEVSFVPIYQRQPLFGDVDVLLRPHGFMLHRFAHFASRTLSPLIVNNDIHAGLSQAFEADAVYIRDFTRFGELSQHKLLKLAVILNDMYGSYDVAYEALATYDERAGTSLGEDYLKRFMAGAS